jgi:A/G-specific adenine glycosylase
MNIAGNSLRKFRSNLLNWFACSQRDLPWRRNRDPYRIWISEIMLQQTRVAAVIPYFENFCTQFPDVRSLAQAPEEKVLRAWSGLGYYSRARNLQAAAKQILNDHRGIFPSAHKEIRALKGIGQYTANALLSIAFGERHAVLDGNVARVLARLNALRGDLHESSRWVALQQTADRLLSPESPGNWNQAMMELGATICTPRSPQCLLCPLQNFCSARKLGLQNLIPEKRKKRPTVRIALAVAVITDSRQRSILLPPALRAHKVPGDIATLVSGMWHFPTVAVKKDPERDLRQYLSQIISHSEKLPAKFHPLRKSRHAVTYRALTIFPFLISRASLPAIPEAKEILLRDFTAFPVSNLTRKVAQAALASL